jgi:pimeloyl-ACP methyl ester carboxylesterase
MRAQSVTGNKRIAQPGRLLALALLLIGTIALAGKVLLTQFPGRLIVLVLLLIIAADLSRKLLRAQAPAKLDLSRLEGKALTPPNADDVTMLGILGNSYVNRLLKSKRYTWEQARVAKLAIKAFQDKDNYAAYRHTTRFLFMVQQRVQPSEAAEVATSLDLRLDRYLVAPGEAVEVSLVPLFTIGHDLTAAYTARLSLRNAADVVQQTLAPQTIKELAPVKLSLPTKDLPAGKYRVHYELFTPTGQSLVTCTRDFLVSGEVIGRLDTLEKQFQQLQDAGTAAKGPAQRTTVETVAYVVDRLAKARRGYAAPMDHCCHPITLKLRQTELPNYTVAPFALDRDLAWAEELARDLLAGKNPLATRTGDLRLAYRSAADRSLEPFRVFIPAGYDPKKTYPLIVALHGGMGDEDTYMDRYPERATGASLFKKLGQERGYILVAPRGRGPWAGYKDLAEQDVLDVTDRMLQLYSIAPGQVFLTGHSMGASGTWMIGFKHPRRFAALAPVAGRPQDLKALPLDKASEKPVWFAYGSQDTFVPPATTDQLADLARKHLTHFQYVKLPDDHFTIGVSSMPGVFDFFDAQRARKRN